MQEKTVVGVKLSTFKASLPGKRYFFKTAMVLFRIIKTTISKKAEIVLEFIWEHPLPPFPQTQIHGIIDTLKSFDQISKEIKLL